MEARHAIAGVLTVVVLAALASTAAAEPVAAPNPVARQCDGTLVVPGRIRINGILGTAETFSASVRLKGLRKEAQPFFLAGTLTSTGSARQRIKTSQIAIANLAEPVKKGRSRAVNISVANVRFAGEYRGQIRADHGACRIPLTVTIAGSADVSLVGGSEKTLHLQIVNCRNLSCGPARVLDFLDRSTARRHAFSPEVDNASQSPALVTGVQVALARNPGGEAIAADALVSSSQRFELPPASTSTLAPIEVIRHNLDPGHYEGGIYLTVLGAEKRVVLPLELDVKVGPLYAIGVLLAALFVQFLVWFAWRSRAKAEELRELRELRKRAKKTLVAEDSALLEGRIGAARNLAKADKVDAAKAARASIEQYIEWLGEVREIRSAMGRTHPGPIPAQMQEDLATFRRAIEADETKAAEEAKGRIRADYGGMAAKRAIALDAGATAPEAAEAPAAEDVKPAAPTVPRTREAIVSLSIFVLPWLLRGLLVVFFVLAGLKELYLDNSTFGSDPMLNYSSLFLWGLTATGVNAALGKVIPGTGT